ncbi:MAG: hypothetical protein J1F11_13520 [Oscillospiraceae bacterium]|nr:hypothetical protein [Oscillospiraceae bacterium]
MMIGGISIYNKNRDFYSKFKNNKTAGIEFTLPAETRKEMTLDQYKKYIDDRISRMSNFGSLFIDISKEGYQAMKDDPDYEKAVLSSIQAEIDRMAGKGEVEVMHIGATKEDSYIEKKLEAMRREIDKIDESWWDRRMELMLENIRLNAAINQKRAREQKEITKGLVFAERLNSAERQEELLKKGESDRYNIDKNSIYAKAAIAAYRASQLMQSSHV